MDILVFDDDSVTADILVDLVTKERWAAKSFPDGNNALEIIRALHPRLVILDVMMPGVDGMNILKALRADPQLARTKVVIVSAKHSPEDDLLAKSLGADSVLRKPFNIASLRHAVKILMGDTPPLPAIEAPAMWVHVRGCWSSGDPRKPTSCVFLALEKARIILDAGTGLAEADLSFTGGVPEVWLLLTHYHPDHLDGLPGLAKLPEGCRLRIAGPRNALQDVNELLQERLSPIRNLVGRVDFQPVGEGDFALAPGLTCSAILTRHPGTTLAYRLNWAGRSLVYCPDNELETAGIAPSDFTAKIAKFVRGADLLFHDARYPGEILSEMRGKGHSSAGEAVKLAAAHGVRRLILFHGETTTPDAVFEAERRSAIAFLGEGLGGLQVICAKPGLELRV